MSATHEAPAPRKKSRWPWVVAILVVVALALFLYMRLKDRSVPEPEPAAARVMELNPVEITTLAPQLLEQTVKVTGTLAPERRADITPQVSGKLQTVNVRPGESVLAGQVIAQIDIRDLRLALNQQVANLNATKAQLTLARTQLDNAQALFDRGTGSKANLDSAQANVNALSAQTDALQTQVDTAERAIQNASITAPFAGIIASRSAEPGQSVTSGSPLVTLVDLSVMEVQAIAPLSDSASLKEGQRATLTVEGIPQQTFEASVDRISPVAIENTRSIPVFLTLKNPDGVFRGGMFTTGSIVVDEAKDALAVPLSALREDKQGDFVLAVADGKLVRQAVEKGRQWSTGNLVQILSGLKAGDVVVTGRLPELEPGTAVTIVGK
ncbi:efflux RND transporter periplasmic adaptor subunit [Paradevosia shaoguanensis]|uniref:Efflux RND transporter periplasmic adaptor subunit n=1 Tax=Paradevosia shaoguanensis TaxID=1335043 RepID=A0AA41UDF0_9HYPH|nr:efflux RND transporter periplasmic adaptor subunit [Paradevosia shaoguanensis]MCF1742776.1 efflux RND transporter periplasmic adaptor subunit [Paradevosia shaoguanensis]MCI0127259.1 efflux RND transporter periplasmic adaptor subunit [Paradevosia shaoguanensis]